MLKRYLLRGYMQVGSKEIILCSSARAIYVHGSGDHGLLCLAHAGCVERGGCGAGGPAEDASHGLALGIERPRRVRPRYPVELVELCSTTIVEDPGGKSASESAKASRPVPVQQQPHGAFHPSSQQQQPIPE